MERTVKTLLWMKGGSRINLSHSLALYHGPYRFRHALLPGRVMSGRGVDLILSRCREAPADGYPAVEAGIRPGLPETHGTGR